MHKSLSNKQILGEEGGGVLGVCLTALINFYKTKLDRYDFNEYQMQSQAIKSSLLRMTELLILVEISRKSVTLSQSSKVS